MEKLVFLIGFMGVGKTTLGKKLANKLAVPFYDSDAEIEKETGMTVNELFSNYGEAYFRSLEKKWLEQFSITKAIVATGGGMPCEESRLSLLKSLGIVIYLERPEKEIFKRLLNGKKTRPLVADLSEEELLEYIQNTLETRSFFYNQADFVLNREQQDVDFIKALLKEV